MHAVSGLCSTTLLCQSEYCDKLCQSVHTYNHLPLPHTKACEQTWNLSTKQRKKKTTAKYFLAKYIPTLLLQWLLAGLGWSLLRASCVPQREEPRAAVPGLGPRGPGRDGQGEAGTGRILTSPGRHGNWCQGSLEAPKCFKFQDLRRSNALCASPSKQSWFPIIGQPMHSTYKALLPGWHVQWI